MRCQPTEIFVRRLEAARTNRNRRVVCEKFHSRIDGRLLHSIRVNDRRGNSKEHLGYFAPADCPLCGGVSGG